MTMNKNTGQLISQFVAERIEVPHSAEIEVWTQLVYCALFSAGYIAWLTTIKKCRSEAEMTSHLNTLISTIAEDAESWIQEKIRQSLNVVNSNITVHSAAIIRFYLNAMFSEAITVMAERSFQPDEARSHACFVHLSRNLQQLTVMGKISSDEYKHVLKQGIVGIDSITRSLTER